jgi:hypothetical protein
VLRQYGMAGARRLGGVPRRAGGYEKKFADGRPVSPGLPNMAATPWPREAVWPAARRIGAPDAAVSEPCQHTARMPVSIGGDIVQQAHIAQPRRRDQP